MAHSFRMDAASAANLINRNTTGIPTVANAWAFDLSFRIPTYPASGKFLDALGIRNGTASSAMSAGLEASNAGNLYYNREQGSPNTNITYTETNIWTDGRTTFQRLIGNFNTNVQQMWLRAAGTDTQVINLTEALAFTILRAFLVADAVFAADMGGTLDIDKFALYTTSKTQGFLDTSSDSRAASPPDATACCFWNDCTGNDAITVDHSGNSNTWTQTGATSNVSADSWAVPATALSTSGQATAAAGVPSVAAVSTPGTGRAGSASTPSTEAVATGITGRGYPGIGGSPTAAVVAAPGSGSAQAAAGLAAAGTFVPSTSGQATAAYGASTVGAASGPPGAAAAAPAGGAGQETVTAAPGSGQAASASGPGGVGAGVSAPTGQGMGAAGLPTAAAVSAPPAAAAQEAAGNTAASAVSSTVSLSTSGQAAGAGGVSGVAAVGTILAARAESAAGLPLRAVVSGPGSALVRATPGQTRMFAGGHPLAYSADSRHLVTTSGVARAIRGRSSWNVLQETAANIASYLDDTVARGLNAIECRAVSSDGTTTSAVRARRAPFANNNTLLPFSLKLNAAAWSGAMPPTTAYGNINNDAPDFTTPVEAYWAFVDDFLAACLARDLLVLFFPAYVGFAGTDQGWMKEMVANGTTKMQAYGAFIANRYKDSPHLVWMIGGDSGTTPDTFNAGQIAVEQALITGMASVSGQRSLLMSAEWNTGSRFTSNTDFTITPYIPLNGCYSFTGDIATVGRGAYAADTIPAFGLEYPYEDEDAVGTNVNPAATAPVRRFTYWAWLSTIAGYMTSNGFVWPFDLAGAPDDWSAHLNTLGAQDLGRLNAFIDSIAASWPLLKPSALAGMATLIASGGGASPASTDYVAAACTTSGNLLLAYVPPAHGGNISVNCTPLAGNARARWFNPSTAAYTDITGGNYTIANTETAHVFTPPGDNGSGFSDWLLVMDVVPSVVALSTTGQAAARAGVMQVAEVGTVTGAAALERAGASGVAVKDFAPPGASFEVPGSIGVAAVGAQFGATADEAGGMTAATATTFATSTSGQASSAAGNPSGAVATAPPAAAAFELGGASGVAATSAPVGARADAAAGSIQMFSAQHAPVSGQATARAGSPTVAVVATLSGGRHYEAGGMTTARTGSLSHFVPFTGSFVVAGTHFHAFTSRFHAG